MLGPIDSALLLRAVPGWSIESCISRWVLMANWISVQSFRKSDPFQKMVPEMGILNGRQVIESGNKYDALKGLLLMTYLRSIRRTPSS
jgi:hypothetical protein